MTPRSGERWARLAVATVVALFVVSARLILAGNPGLLAGDFPVFYGAAQRLTLGRPLYAVGMMAYLNPPFFALLLVPLLSLPVPPAHLVWAALMLVATALSCRLLLGRGPATPRRRVWLWASLLSLPVFLADVYQGQNTALLLLGLALWYALMRRGHPYLAGAALGLMLVKPQFALGPAVALLAARRWRELAGLALVSAGLGALSLALVGLDGLRDYLAVARDVSGWVALGPFFRSDMHTPRALLYSLLPPDAASAASLAASAVFVALLARRAWRDRALGPATVALAALASLLAAPYAHTHDLVLLIVPWLLLGPTAPRWLALLLVASYVAPVIHIVSVGFGGPAQLTVLVNVPLFFALALTPPPARASSPPATDQRPLVVAPALASVAAPSAIGP